MASISTDGKGNRTIQFVAADKRRRSIRLGKMPLRHVRSIRDRVESMVAAKIAGCALDGDTLEWVETKAGDVLCDKLASVGLILPRSSIVLDQFLAAYIDGRTDVSDGSVRNMNQAARYLREHFGARPLREITTEDASSFAVAMRTNHAEATAARVVKYARQFWDHAIRCRYIGVDIWDHVKVGRMDNPDRQFFVTHEMTSKIVAACPDAEWRLIVALARYGGLRIPSEAYVLEWPDILWDQHRFVCRSPKTGTRIVPIFRELRPYIEACYDLAADGAVHVIATHRQVSLRTRMLKIIARAGLVPWEKPFQNLRASRETELCDEFPEHVVCKWIGNSKAVARAHYNQITDAHFERAAKSGATCATSSDHKRSPNESDGVENVENERKESLVIAHDQIGEADKYARRDSNQFADSLKTPRSDENALQNPVQFGDAELLRLHVSAHMKDDMMIDDMLKEIAECQGAVNDSEYKPEERKRLRELERAGLVSLVWAITPKGVGLVAKTEADAK